MESCSMVTWWVIIQDYPALLTSGAMDIFDSDAWSRYLDDVDVDGPLAAIVGEAVVEPHWLERRTQSCRSTPKTLMGTPLLEAWI